MPLPAVLDGAGIVHAGLVDMLFVAITAKLAMAKQMKGTNTRRRHGTFDFFF